MDGEHIRAQDQARNLARHLNDRHPDTILFLAQQAADRPPLTRPSSRPLNRRG